MKRLFIDIETCPNIVTSWRIGFNINLTPDNIVEERRIICASWKWQGAKRVENVAWDQHQCDKKAVEKIVSVLNNADEIVYQNGDKFDLPWIKTRAIFHGIKMLPKYQTFDTYKKIRSNFYFNSNRLDYVQRFLGGAGKLETGGFDLWKKVHLNNDRKALKKMVKYCDQDITELEEMFYKLLPYVPHKTHAGVVMGGPKWSCANCGSEDVKLHQVRYTAYGTARIQMRCKSCHSSYTISQSDYNQFQEEVH